MLPLPLFPRDLPTGGELVITISSAICKSRLRGHLGATPGFQVLILGSGFGIGTGSRVTTTNVKRGLNHNYGVSGLAFGAGISIDRGKITGN